MEGLAFTDLDTAAEQETGLSFVPQEEGLPKGAAELKAETTGIALGENSPELADLTASYSWSKDDSIWRQTIQQEEYQQSMSTQATMLSDIISGKTQASMSDISSVYQGVSDVDTARVPYDTSVNLEMKFGEKFTDFVATALDVENYQQQLETPEGIDAHLDWAEETAFIRSTQELLAEVNEADRGLSLNDVYEFGTGMLPFVNYTRMMNEVEGAPSTSWMPGENFRQQYTYVMSLPPKDRITAVQRHVAKLRDEGLYDGAANFLNAVLGGYTHADATFDTGMELTFNALEFTPIGLFADAARGAKAVGRAGTRRLAASAPKESILKETSEGVGDYDTSSSFKLVKQFEGVAGGIDDIQDKAVGVYNSHRYLRGVDSNGNVHYNKVLDAVTRGDEIAVALTDDVKVARLNPVQFQEAVATTTARLTSRYTKNADNVINVEEKFIPATNTTAVYVNFGHKNGQLFETQAKAQRWVNTQVKPKTDDWEIVPVGDGFAVRIAADVDETMSVFDPIKLSTEETIKDTFANRFFAGIRNPRDVLGTKNFGSRLAALHGESRLNNILSDLVKPFERMRKGETEEVIEMLEMQRDTLVSQGDRGFYFDTAEEFEAAFKQKFKKNPTQLQHEANWAYRQAMDIDFLMRATGRYRDITRVGGKQIDFTFKDKNGKRQTFSGLGRQVDKIDYAKNGVVKHIDRSGKVSPQKMTPEDVEKIRARGGEIYETIETPFRITDKSIAHYVIVENGAKVNRVKFTDVLNYNPGGHVQYKYPFFVKQAQLAGEGGARYFTGDQTIINAVNEKQAAEIANLYEKVRLSMSDGTDDWKKIVDEQMTWTTRKEVELAFKGKKGKGGYLDLDTPIQFVRAGTRTIDTAAMQGLKPTDSAFNQLGDLERKFTQERGANYTTLYEEEQGVFKELGSAKALMDPLETLNVATRNSINARAQKDYIIRSTNEIMNNFSDIIKPEVLKKAQNNPIEFLYGEENFLSGASKDMRNLADTARRAVLRQIGQVDRTSMFIDSFRERLTNLAMPEAEWSKLGAKGWVARASLPLVKDPIVFFKNVAFDLKLGLFNPLQIIVQAQTLTHTFGMNPKNAPAAFYASVGMQMDLLNKNPGIWKHVAKAVEKTHGSESAVKMSKEMYLESREALERSGWHLVGRDLGYLDDISNYSVIETKRRRMLESGRVFFNGVERMLRLNGWNMAYLDWKAANAGKKLNDDAISWIIDKADDYTVNMSSANNAVWQKGAVGAMTQFASYQIRLMEQFLPSLIGGGRIPPSRAWKMFAIYSGMYGVGFGGMGAAVGGVWPVGEEIKKYMEANGYSVDDTYLEFLQDGIPSQIFEMMTGMDLDFSQRYAPSGYTLFRDLLSPDTDVHPMELVSGAPGSIGWDVATGLKDTALAAFYDAANLEDSSSPMAVTGESMNEVLKNISSYKLGFDLYYAWNYGLWMQRNGREVANLDPVEATVARALGAAPQEVNDSYLRNTIMRQEKEAKTYAAREAKIAYRRALKDTENGLYNSPHYAYAKSLLIGAGYTSREAGVLLAASLRESNLIEKTEEQWEKHKKDKGF